MYSRFKIAALDPSRVRVTCETCEVWWLAPRDEVVCWYCGKDLTKRT